MVTGLIFSKDRAMQLDATLRSFFLNCVDSNNVNLYVLYKASEGYKEEYENLKEEYPKVNFVEETHFYEDTLSILRYAEYILFLVDDCIFIDKFRLCDIETCLEKSPEAIGFSLRLGENTKYCYMLDKQQKIPEFKKYYENIKIYNWVESEYDFGYPLEVSSSVYRGEDIYLILSNSRFSNPNVLEVILDAHKHFYPRIMPKIFCYSKSVAFCNPINVVQESWENKSGKEDTLLPFVLNSYYRMGYRIDIEKFQKIVPNSVHQEMKLDFCEFPIIASSYSSKKFENKKVDYENPLTSIIIPNLNRVEVLKKCLESIKRNTLSRHEIIVIDNGSTDGSIEYLKKIDWIKLICNKENLGVPYARNQGLNASSGEYIVSMDNDVIVTPGWLDIFIHYASKLSPQIALFGPRTNFISGPQIVNNVEYSTLEELDQFSKDWREKAKDKLHLILRLVGFCIFMRRKLIDHIGGFDSFGLFGYEDDDFSFRSRIAGFENIVVNEVFVHHVAGPHCRVKDKNHNLYLKRVVEAEDNFRKKWGVREDGGNIVEILSQPFDKSKHYVDIKDFLWQR